MLLNPVKAFAHWVELFLRAELAQHGFASYVPSENPECNAIRSILKLANSWQIGFLRDIPPKGKSENSRIFTGDFDGGPGWT